MGDKFCLQNVYLTKQKILLELHITKLKKYSAETMNALQNQWRQQTNLIAEIEHSSNVWCHKRMAKKVSVTFLKIARMKDLQLKNITNLNIKKAFMKNIFFV